MVRPGSQEPDVRGAGTSGRRALVAALLRLTHAMTANGGLAPFSLGASRVPALGGHGFVFPGVCCVVPAQPPGG